MSIVAETATLAERTLRRFLRTPQAVVAAVAFPLLLLFLQLAAFGGLVRTAGGGNYIYRLAPLIAIASTGFGAAVTGVGFWLELRGGVLRRLRAMPVSSGSLLAGRVAADTVRALAAAVVVTVVAFIPGFRFSVGPLAVLGYFGVVLLFALMWTWIAVLAAFGGSGPESVQSLLSVPSTLLVFLSSGFVPVEAFPGVLQPVVRANPVSVGVNALIGLSSGGPVAVPVLQTLGWTLGLGALCAVLAIRRYRAQVRT